MKAKKVFSGKRILALILALVMAFSVMPVAFAAEPTGPVQQTAGNHVDGVDAGHYVSFRADYQNFVFIQTQDDQAFRFQFNMYARKNQGVNYGWVYTRDDSHPQTLTTAIGKSFTVDWDNYIGALPGTLFGGNDWRSAVITVNFVADGGKVYDTALQVNYDGRSTGSGGQTHLTWDIPLSVTVIDKRALNSAIAAAKAAEADAEYYTEATWGDVVNALANAQTVAGDVIAQQSVIDKYAQALQLAVDALEYQSADYTALDAAKADAKAILDNEKVDETYTGESLALLREKYDAALQVPADLDVRQQAQIDKAASELADAVAGLVKFANYTLLQSAVNAFNNLNPAYFDADDFAAVKALADEAKEALKPENRLPATEQAKVTEQARNLLAAINGLKKLPANYEAFDVAVSLAKAKLESSEIQNYTAISVKALEDAYLASANVERDKDITYQETVDAATKAITDALAGLTLKGADYTKLDAAIAAAEAELKRSDIADFTDASVQALKDALAAAKGVSRELTVDQQNVIDDARDALVAATHLVLKDADYSALDAAIEARETELANARESGKYTDASMVRLEAAIGVAKAVDRTYSIKEQSKVDDAVKALNSVQLEKKAADTAALEAAIEAAQKTLNEAGDEYTDESKTALAEAIKKAREVLVTYGGDVDNQAIIDKAVTDLEAVKLQLKKADYTDLDAAIEAAEKFLADPETEKLYTPEAIQKVKDALEKANSVDRDLTIRDQQVVDNAAGALVEAMPGDSGYKEANLEALIAAIAAADKKLAAEDIADYTEESIAALKAARDDAQAMVDRKPSIKEQDDVDAKAAALNAMELALKGADYSALEAAVEKATSDYAKAEASGLYTEASLQEFMAAIISANALLDNRTLTIKEQNIVDNAAEALKVELTYKNADLSELVKAIAAAEAKMAAPGYGDYTLASRQALEAALAEAKALRDEMPNILRQADVDAAAEKLNNVKLSLQGADYTALDEIIAEAKALLETNLSDKYTNVSIDVMKAALVEAENIDRELDVSDQDYVDAAAQALRNAIDALNPYNKVTGVEITQNGQVVDGQVAYVKVPWYKTYKSQSTTLSYQLSSDANVASVKWELANWSVENPEADIIDNGNGTVTIKPNGKGIGARSCWVKVTVTDVNGNTVEDIVKVRFYNWDWQK